MTEQEFTTEVLGTFRRCFPSTIKWLSELPEGGREVLRQWYRELEDFAVYRVTAAIERIHAGKQAGPHAYDRESWPAFIRLACNSWQDTPPEESWRQTSHECQICEDLGSVAIWSKDSVKRVLIDPNVTDGDLERMPAWWIQCTCRRGKRQLSYRDRPPKPLPQYDPERVVLRSAGVEALRQHINDRALRLPAGEAYNEFAEWS